MKKITLLITILLMILSLYSCAPIQRENSEVLPSNNSSPEPIVIEQHSDSSYVYFEDFKALEMAYDYMIMGKVTKFVETQRVDFIEYGIVESTDKTPDYENVSTFEIQVLESYKGSFEEGDTFLLDQHGGTAENITEINYEHPIAQEGEVYFFFMCDTDAMKGAKNAPGREQPYFIINTGDYFLGSHRIVDGKISSPSKDGKDGKTLQGHFVKDGMTVDEVRAMIQEALKQPPKEPVNE